MSQRAPAPELNVPYISLQDWKAAAPSATVVFQHDLLGEALNRGLSVLARRKGRVEKTKGLNKSKGDHNTTDCVWFFYLFVFFGLQHCSQEAFNQSCTECKLSAWLTKEGYCPCALYFFSFHPETTKQCWSLWGTSHFLEAQRCNWPISAKGIGSRCFLAENDKSGIRWTVSTSLKLINAAVMDWNSGSGLSGFSLY